MQQGTVKCVPVRFFKKQSFTPEYMSRTAYSIAVPGHCIQYVNSFPKCSRSWKSDNHKRSCITFSDCNYTVVPEISAQALSTFAPVNLRRLPVLQKGASFGGVVNF